MTLYFGQKKMATNKKKNKPVDYDINLKYLCPSCGDNHWLSFQEASTIDFKVVCYCGTVFTVKQIEAFKIKYTTSDSQVVVEEKQKPVIPDTLLNQASEALINYGFTAKEAKELIQQAYELNPTDNYVNLVKQSLEMLRNNNVI